MSVSRSIILSPPRPHRRTARSTQRGFTLIEVLFAAVLISLILTGVVDLFLAAAKLTFQANAISDTGLSSANAVQQILKDAREAESLRLPSDTTASQGVPAFQTLPGYTNIAASYETALNGQTVMTALELNVPPLQTQTVLDAGGHSITLDGSTGAKTVYDRTATNSDWILYYRGDANQVPNPSQGQRLWKYQHSTGATALVCRSLAVNAPDAVQFLQPTGVNTEIAVKVVSADYSLVKGQQTNEESDGSTTSSLTGKCAFMRDNGIGVVQSAGAGSGTCNHAFQHN